MSGREKDVILEGLEAIEKGEISKEFDSAKEAIEFLNNLEEFRSMKNNIEIEIQVQVDNIEPLLDFLKAKGSFQKKHHQTDEYFTPCHRNFLGVRPAVEWLRLRDNDGVFSTTYKNWHVDEEGKTQYADEYETKIESLDQLRKIFTVIDIKPLITVYKERDIWLYKDYEVAIDKIKGLGDFVEIEYKGNNRELSPKEVTTEMVKFLKDVGCGTIKRNYVGYPFMLLYPNEIELDIL